MGETNWVLRDWEPQTLFRAGKNLYESDTHDFLLSFVSRKLRNRWHRVTEGKTGFLERKKKNNSHSLILEKLSPRTSKEIESLNDEMSPTKHDTALEKKLSHFLDVCFWNDWTWIVRRRKNITLSYLFLDTMKMNIHQLVVIIKLCCHRR